MKSVPSQRTRYRRLPLLVVLLIAAAVVTYFVLIDAVKRRLIESTGESLALAASDIADKLDLFYSERANDVAVLASSADLGAADRNTLNAHLQTVHNTHRVYERLTAADSNGKTIASTDPADLLLNHAAAKWFRTACNISTIEVQVVPPDKEHGERAVIFAKALRDERNQVTLVVAARSALTITDSLFEDTLRSFASLSSTKSHPSWQIIAHDGQLLHDSRLGPPPPEGMKYDGPASDRSSWREAIDPIRRVPVIQGLAPLKGRNDFPKLGLGVIVEIDRTEALATMHRVLWQILLPSASIVLPLFALLLWSAFQLRRDWERIASSESHLATTLRSIAEGVILTDAKGRVTMVNDAAETLTGWRENDAKGKHFGDVVHVIDRETHKPLEPLAAQALRGEQTLLPGSPVLLVSRDGTERIVQQSAAPIPSSCNNAGVAGVALVCRDVTERELAEAAYRASQDSFRLITENMTDVVTLHALDGRMVFQSRNKYTQLKIPEAAVPFENVVEEDRAMVREHVRQLVSTGEPQRLEFRMRLPDKSVIVVESVGTLVRRADGTPERIVAVSRDVTERRETEQRLIAEKEFNDTLLASLPGIFFVCDSQRRLLRWNRNFELVVGYSATEIAELELLAFFPLQEQERVAECVYQCVLGGKADLETTLWHRNGRLTAFYISGLRCEVNDQPAMLCIGIDINARKAAEDALIATSQRLERQNLTLGEQARNPALRGDDLNLAFRTITEVASRTLGVSRTSVWFYQRDEAAIHCEDIYDHPTGTHTKGSIIRESECPTYFQALAEGRVIPAHYARNDPRTREFTDSYLKPLGITSMLDAPIRLEGRLIGIICHEHTGSPREWTLDEQNFAGSMADLVALSLEVWQRRQAESALREARDQLEVKVAERTRELSDANAQLKELDRLKSEFLATMSHELRTPMNSIIGFTGILRKGLAGPLNDEQKKQLGMVNFSAKHLLELINGLLDLSRIESGKVDVSAEDFRVGDVVHEVLETLMPAANQKGLSLECDVDEPAKVMHSDQKRTYQILLNLVNNALKFTEKGSVKIVVQNDGSSVQFDVIDTGIGIKPEQLANLFQAFRQVDGSARRVYEGTGLGLYLSKKLVNMLGGTIGAESNFGVGSRFYFTLPVTLPKSNSPNERQDSPRGR